MAHGPLKKSTQINTKQHVVFLLYQNYYVDFLEGASRKLSRGPQKDLGPQFENH